MTPQPDLPAVVDALHRAASALPTEAGDGWPPAVRLEYLRLAIQIHRLEGRAIKLQEKLQRLP